MLRCLAVTWNFPRSLLLFLVVLIVSGVLLDTPTATVLSCSGKISGTVPSPKIMPMERAGSRGRRRMETIAKKADTKLVEKQSAKEPCESSALCI